MIGTCCAKYFSNCIFENTKNNLQQKKNGRNAQTNTN